jgi:hypothetical protein
VTTMTAVINPLVRQAFEGVVDEKGYATSFALVFVTASALVCHRAKLVWLARVLRGRPRLAYTRRAQVGPVSTATLPTLAEIR